jgi:hypothetical protein
MPGRPVRNPARSLTDAPAISTHARDCYAQDSSPVSNALATLDSLLPQSLPAWGTTDESSHRHAGEQTGVIQIRGPVRWGCCGAWCRSAAASGPILAYVAGGGHRCRGTALDGAARRKVDERY